MKNFTLILFLSLGCSILFNSTSVEARHRPHRRHGLRNLWKRNRAQFMGFFYSPSQQWIGKKTMAASDIYEIVKHEATLPDGTYLKGAYLGEPQYALASWQTRELPEADFENNEDNANDLYFDENQPGVVIATNGTTPLDKNDDLYWVIPCRALNNDEPVRQCIRFHYYLNWASPIYNSWVAAHAYTQVAARIAALRELMEEKASEQTIKWFLSRVETFEEVNEWGYVVAMKHWQELVENWDVLGQKLPVLGSNNPPKFYDFVNDSEHYVSEAYLGRPAEHDYFKGLYRVAWQTNLNNRNSMTVAYQFQQLAVYHQASPSELYPLWDNANDPTLEIFLKRVRHRFLGKHSHVESLAKYLNSPVYGKAAKKIMDYFSKAVSDEVNRRSHKNNESAVNNHNGSNPSNPPVVELSSSEKLVLEGQKLIDTFHADKRTLSQIRRQIKQAQSMGDLTRAEILQDTLTFELRRLKHITPVNAYRLLEIANLIKADKKDLAQEFETMAKTMTETQY